MGELSRRLSSGFLLRPDETLLLRLSLSALCPLFFLSLALFLSPSLHLPSRSISTLFVPHFILFLFFVLLLSPPAVLRAPSSR